ncbi:MAG: PilZ domain-containing protein [Candidatus Omnitrophica bacterium]|nr:PilZ domain-containing protein [Candidatus Omnitrophota bacterium]
MKERRRYTRVGISLPVKYKISNSNVWYDTVTLNISAGGVLIPTIKNLEVGTNINLQIHLPDLKKPIMANGRVAWKKMISEFEGFDLRQIEGKFFTGIEFAKFTKINEDNIVKIMEFVYKYLHINVKKKKILPKIFLSLK